MLDQSPSETDQFNDLYPARRGSGYKFSMWEKGTGLADERGDKDLCGARVVEAMENEKLPLVRLMVSALKARGCMTDVFERHFSCDICKPGDKVENLAAYDDQFNQAFICANNVGGSGQVYGSLLRQLIVMFDACTQKYDFKNARHLACTEIRKANLADCNLFRNLTRSGSTLEIGDGHRSCVKGTAKLALEHLRFVPKDVAHKAVDDVFEKCYNDLEPIGRRCNSKWQFKLCDNEKAIHGYE